ncbi:hypothetical protein BKA58DRAFT_452822 [Alternaria rosae]|uniref:uncharacterized protein n=1 Tax=Alternaria rosae TaxID=1187941 RepID=UPI001E8D6BA9|nr:uncharacterized protein BKA58DRAFT_452822 [Alternaria rosae]KAH6878662.1 hypothetical protein BKA58DRAFT_452822 [Alternaria rosae]
MDLIELPVELLSRVCRFLGRASGTNKEKTEFDASIRYGLHECCFDLNPSSLALFLRLSRIPAYRNRMARINICELTRPSTTSDYEWYLLHEDEYSFARSGEAARVPAPCFRQLRDADSFIELELPYGTHIIGEQKTVLRALQLSQFPEKIAYIHLWLENSQKPEWELFADSLSEFRPWIKKAVFLTPKTRGKDVAKSREVGAHIKNVRRVHPDVLGVVAATTDVERLQLQGCNEVPELRICHGCSIYQGLRKLPLWHVNIGRNYQKRGALTPAELPHACRNGHANKSRNGAYNDNINALIDAMIAHFHVCRVRREQEYRGPKYFKVCFFDVPGLLRKVYKSDIQRYAVEVEGN